MRKLLIISHSQYGSLTDTYKYCQYLDDFYITYLSFDFGLPKRLVPNGKLIYVPHTQIKILNGILFLLYSIIVALFHSGPIFVVYFPHCSIIKKVLFGKKMNVDIRTLSVAKTKIKRYTEDRLLKKEIVYFDSISIIAKELAVRCGIDTFPNVYILPLGADVISTNDKDFSDFRLLYVGTLYNRHIIETVKGIELFLKKNPDSLIHYDIIGGGEELEEIESYIKQKGLSNKIVTYGTLPFEKVKPFMDKCNIGISYIPMTDWYDFQPPTKTYEYILSGMYCIATQTYANSQIITKENGILHTDNPLEFCNALESAYYRRNILNSEKIRNTLKESQWKIIVDKYLRQIIK